MRVFCSCKKKIIVCTDCYLQQKWVEITSYVTTDLLKKIKFLILMVCPRPEFMHKGLWQIYHCIFPVFISSKSVWISLCNTKDWLWIHYLLDRMSLHVILEKSFGRTAHLIKILIGSSWWEFLSVLLHHKMWFMLAIYVWISSITNFSK